MHNQIEGTNSTLIDPEKMNHIISEIRGVLDSARERVAAQVNSELLITYWNVGRIIAEFEQTIPDRADYGKQTLKELS